MKVIQSGPTQKERKRERECVCGDSQDSNQGDGSYSWPIVNNFNNNRACITRVARQKGGSHHYWAMMLCVIARVRVHNKHIIAFVFYKIEAPSGGAYIVGHP